MEGRLGLPGAPTSFAAVKQLGPDARVADSMTSPLPTLGHRRCLDEASGMLQDKATPAIGRRGFVREARGTGDIKKQSAKCDAA